MIPKVINYCWFGKNEKPQIVKECIESWKKYCPEFEIKQWDESNYDVNKNVYVKEAYDQKKWAFLTDYARLDILYHNGGVYMDTDVKLIKSIAPLINKGAFMAFEQRGRVNTGVGFACEAGNLIVKENMRYYEEHNFIDKSGNFNPEICVKITTKILINHGLDYTKNSVQKLNKLMVYSSDYFSPKKMGTNKINITNNTYGIHLYASSWYKGSPLIKKIKYRLIPLKEFVKYKILNKKLYE